MSVTRLSEAFLNIYPSRNPNRKADVILNKNISPSWAKCLDDLFWGNLYTSDLWRWWISMVRSLHPDGSHWCLWQEITKWMSSAISSEKLYSIPNISKTTVLSCMLRFQWQKKPSQLNKLESHALQVDITNSWVMDCMSFQQTRVLHCMHASSTK